MSQPKNPNECCNTLISGLHILSSSWGDEDSFSVTLVLNPSKFSEYSLFAMDVREMLQYLINHPILFLYEVRYLLFCFFWRLNYCKRADVDTVLPMGPRCTSLAETSTTACHPAATQDCRHRGWLDRRLFRFPLRRPWLRHYHI